MPTAIDLRSRRTALRQLLGGLGQLGSLGLGAVGLRAWARPDAAAGADASVPPSAAYRLPASPTLVAAWDDEARRHWAGLLREDATDPAAPWRILSAIELPTRAHGLLLEPGGSVLICARRPGEWLLRWWPDGAQKPRWHWSEPDRRFTGHTLAAPGDARTLFTIEADQASGQGLLVQRDAASLAVRAEWPTHGIDPHEALWESAGPGHPAGSILLANGGVPTLPETGRTRRGMERMDSSLVRLDVASGALRQQWRLADARLSLRHLARHPSGVVAISIQAEHDDPAQRAAAPLLALLDVRSAAVPGSDGPALRLASQARELAGYGGDVVAVADGFLIGATRAGGVAQWSVQGQWQGFMPLAEACALAAEPQGTHWWAGGRQQIAAGGAAAPTFRPTGGLRLDNHALLAGVSLST